MLRKELAVNMLNVMVCKLLKFMQTGQNLVQVQNVKSFSE